MYTLYDEKVTYAYAFDSMTELFDELDKMFYDKIESDEIRHEIEKIKHMIYSNINFTEYYSDLLKINITKL